MEGIEKVSVDLHYSFEERIGDDYNNIIMLFGWSPIVGGAVEASQNCEIEQDSGLAIINGGICVKENPASYLRSYSDMKTVMNIYNIYLAEAGTLRQNTWYTIERILDKRITGKQMQKVYVYERESGDCVFTSDWIQAGNTVSAVANYRSIINAKFCKENDVIMLDNYRISVIKGDEELKYEYLPDSYRSDYLQTGRVFGLKPSALKLMASDMLEEISGENVSLSVDGEEVESTLFKVTPNEERIGFDLNFEKLKEDTEYTLIFKNLRYSMYSIPLPAIEFKFTTNALPVEEQRLKDENGYTIPDGYQLKAGEKVFVHTKLLNCTEGDVPYMVILCLYFADHRLIGTAGEWGVLAAEQDIQVDTDILTVLENNCHTEIFILDNLQNMLLRN